VLREIVHELLGIAPGLARIHLELQADSAGHDIRQWRAAVRCLPYHCSDFVESEKSRVHRRHDHHFAADEAGSDGGTPRDVLLGYNVVSSG
jgi:hypothetical protein